MATVVKKFYLQNAATSTGNGTAFNTINKHTEIIFDISGTSTSRTCVFEYSDDDGATYLPLACVNISTLAIASTSTGTGETWSANVTGLNYFRVRISAVSGGNVTVKGKVLADVV